jgi:2'-5' RNA ligase
MTDEPNDDATETNYNLNESADKIRLSTKLKRGTGTRDQDTHTLKARGETPEEAADNLSAVLAELEAHNVFDRMRAVGNDDE